MRPAAANISNGIILAEYLGWEFIDAAEVIFFDANHRFDSGSARRRCSPRAWLAPAMPLSPASTAAIPTAPSAPSPAAVQDVTGDRRARRAQSFMKNWTDVSGF